MTTYDIRNPAGQIIGHMIAKGVADTFAIDVNDLLWAIEEEGQCTVLNGEGCKFTVIEHKMAERERREAKCSPAVTGHLLSG